MKCLPAMEVGDFQQFLEVYNHVSEMEGFKALVSTVWDSERTVSLVESEEGSVFVPTLKGQINWNPTQGLEFDDRTLSPATILGHEFEHADSYLKNRNAYIERRNRVRSDGFSNDEEYRVISGPEIQMQLNMGEINEGQGPRKHSGPQKGRRVKTTGPTSSKVIRKQKR